MLMLPIGETENVFYHHYKVLDYRLFKVPPYIFDILEPLLFNGVIEPFFIT